MLLTNEIPIFIRFRLMGAKKGLGRKGVGAQSILATFVPALRDW